MVVCAWSGEQMMHRMTAMHMDRNTQRKGEQEGGGEIGKNSACYGETNVRHLSPCHSFIIPIQFSLSLVVCMCGLPMPEMALPPHRSTQLPTPPPTPTEH